MRCIMSCTVCENRVNMRGKVHNPMFTFITLKSVELL